MYIRMYTLIFPILTGWLAGWLVNYLADVLPATRRFSQPACPKCGKPFRWRDYLALRKCQGCGQPRGMRSWLVQILALAASMYLWLYPPKGLGYGLGVILLIYLAVVLLIDLEHRLILHPVSLFGALLGLGVGVLVHGVRQTFTGGLAGLGIMLIFYLFGLLFTRLRARRMQRAGQAADDEEALGAGDVFLAGILGLMLGWPLIWFGLLLGILASGLVSLMIVIGLLATKKYQVMSIFIPFGPYFILSTFFLIYLPNWISSVVPK